METDTDDSEFTGCYESFEFGFVNGKRKNSFFDRFSHFLSELKKTDRRPPEYSFLSSILYESYVAII